MKILSIKELTVYIKNKLESDPLLNNVWIKGEVSNFKHHSSGHMYLTLKDSVSSVRAVMFRSRNHNLGFIPKDGMAVLVRGYVTVYERDGQYQFYIEEMQPHGVGSLHIAFLQLKEKLEQEGLFNQARKRPLPAFPRKIGVVTSPTGAAVRDVIHILTRRFPQVHIIVVPVAVQGEGAPRQIADGIKLANSLADVDLLIVGRGGGSLEELWAFNTEEVARAIFESTLPVISAVGHETDFTIADFVADLRAPTPSAAAEIAVPDRRELKKHLSSLESRLLSSLKNYLTVCRQRVRRAEESITLKRPKDALHRRILDLENLHRRLTQAASATLERKKSVLALHLTQLDSLSPLATMKRGFSVCLNPEGTLVRQAGQVKPGDQVKVKMYSGNLDCSVLNVEEATHDPREK